MEITNLQGTVRLSNGVEMPYLGLGVFQAQEGEEVMEAVQYALGLGYRHIDTASMYLNEVGVGRAVATSGIARREVFITTKVWNSDQGYENTLKAFDASLKRLGLDYIDLYLVHWPVRGRFVDTWLALENLYNQGMIRAIGVSNFLKHQIEELTARAAITPMVNQMEFHPYLVQQELIDYCTTRGIRYQAWSPLMQGRVLSIPQLVSLAQKYGRSVPQLVIRWSLQKGVATIPKSVSRERIKENADVFGFEISEPDMEAINALDRNHRIGAHPDTFDF